MDSEKGLDFDIEKVSPIWLVTALCIFPLGVYYLLNLLGRLLPKSTDLTISEIYVYPIKSLRAVKVTSAVATRYGFQHDRIFMLLQKAPDGYKNMVVYQSQFPGMTQFLQEMDEENITVHYRAYGDATKAKTLKIPLAPETEALEPIEVNMHSSPTTGFKMPKKYSTWFSECFGYEVILVYLGGNKRDVLFQNMLPTEPAPLTNFLKKNMPSATSYAARILGLPEDSQWKITFADCAPYLITSQTSLEDVSSRLPEGEDMDMTKFRPNIVVKGAAEPYQEDYWGTLKINNQAEIIMKHNCVRCQSINLDYETGKQAVGAKGEVLKRLQKDRRVDVGAKWSPVFGRYGFWDPVWKGQRVKVGDGVDVIKVNGGRTEWSWPNLG